MVVILIPYHFYLDDSLTEMLLIQEAIIYFWRKNFHPFCTKIYFPLGIVIV
jgi:hypothetical protein